MSNIVEEETKLDNENELKFISSTTNYDNLKVNPPKRWFNVCVALLIATIGSCCGAIIGLVINYVAK